MSERFRYVLRPWRKEQKEPLREAWKTEVDLL